QMSGDEIRVEVRQKNVPDREPVLARERQVLIDVPLRIDDGRRPGLLIADEVRRVRETIEIKLLENHGLESSIYEQVYTRRISRSHRGARRCVRSGPANPGARNRRTGNPEPAGSSARHGR